jgi:hypothetical protein
MLEGRTYVPLLHARLAEMRALRELPTETKNLIFPVIRVRPWLNSKSLRKVFGVINDAFGERAYGLDLDATKLNPNSEKPAQQEFAELFDPEQGFAAYYNFVSEKPNRIPVIRRAGGNTPQLEAQVERIADLSRGAVFRLNPDAPGDHLLFAHACVEQAIENVLFILDCGWRLDVLGLAQQCTAIVNQLVGVDDQLEIVVAGSSFPNTFAEMGARSVFPINERILFQNVRQNVNQGNLYYGDWGSTRPPTDPVPMTNVPRIDVANRDRWLAWRSEDGESYEDIAERVVDDPAWNGNTGLWGNYMIASTAEGLDPAIRAPAMAAAVRVNLHMNAQARFDAPDGLAIEDEPVGEDL